MNHTIQENFLTLIKLVSIKHNMIKESLNLGLRYIQELLGHKSSKTTEIYTYVSSKDFMRIRNPLDQILKEKKDG